MPWLLPYPPKNHLWMSLSPSKASHIWGFLSRAAADAESHSIVGTWVVHRVRNGHKCRVLVLKEVSVFLGWGQWKPRDWFLMFLFESARLIYLCDDICMNDDCVKMSIVDSDTLDYISTWGSRKDKCDRSFDHLSISCQNMIFTWP